MKSAYVGSFHYPEKFSSNLVQQMGTAIKAEEEAKRRLPANNPCVGSFRHAPSSGAGGLLDILDDQMIAQKRVVTQMAMHSNEVQCFVCTRLLSPI